MCGRGGGEARVEEEDRGQSRGAHSALSLGPGGGVPPGQVKG